MWESGALPCNCERTIEIWGTGPSLTLKDGIGPDMWVSYQPSEQHVATLVHIPFWRCHACWANITRTSEICVPEVEEIPQRFQGFPFLGNLGDPDLWKCRVLLSIGSSLFFIWKRAQFLAGLHKILEACPTVKLSTTHPGWQGRLPVSSGF